MANVVITMLNFVLPKLFKKNKLFTLAKFKMDFNIPGRDIISGSDTSSVVKKNIVYSSLNPKNNPIKEPAYEEIPVKQNTPPSQPAAPAKKRRVGKGATKSPAYAANVLEEAKETLAPLTKKPKTARQIKKEEKEVNRKLEKAGLYLVSSNIREDGNSDNKSFLRDLIEVIREANNVAMQNPQALDELRSKKTKKGKGRPQFGSGKGGSKSKTKRSPASRGRAKKRGKKKKKYKKKQFRKQSTRALIKQLQQSW